MMGKITYVQDLEEIKRNCPQGWQSTSWDESEAWWFYQDVTLPLREHWNEYAPLYSPNKGAPSIDPTLMTAAWIYAKSHNISEAQMENKMLQSMEVQVALGLYNYPRKPFTRYQFIRFRNKIVQYEDKTGVNLMEKVAKTLPRFYMQIMEIGPLAPVRVDSGMLAANIRIMPRHELLFQGIRQAVRELIKKGDPKVLETPGFEEHYDKYNSRAHRNTLFYKKKGAVPEIVTSLADDYDGLLQINKKCGDALARDEKFGIMMRLFDEQTIYDDSLGTVRLKTQDDHAMHSGMLQSPFETGCTYHKKPGPCDTIQEVRGYVGNLYEAVGEHGSLSRTT